ncbi:MAG: M14 family metallopeptidase [Congregibacter sp.]
MLVSHWPAQGSTCASSPYAALFFALLLLLIAPLSPAQALWPDEKYDPAIPTVRDVLGYNSGERITWSHDVRRYFEALADAAGDRVQIVDYAKSWEGRQLFYVVISSADNIARSADIRAGMQALRDPKNTSAKEVDELIAGLAPVTWLAYGVHGNEISSTDAAMMTAYHLLAATRDKRVATILADTVVVVNPMQNPDGRDRFIHRFESALGLEPSSDRISAEHNEPWPNGRTNHYLFDLNRDWFIRTQPETRGHADAVSKWLPIAFVDLHEMGSDSSYYFAPEAIPFNPHLAADQRASLELFGRTNAGWFDRFGIDYFTREVFDAFYPGYGASWPAYFGAVAMTYEQASARGLLVRQYDGRELSYEKTVRNHFLTSLGTAETVAVNRRKLLREFYEYQRTAITEGSEEATRSYIVPAQADQNGVDRLGALLAAQGVVVERSTAAFDACGQAFASGSLVINLDQPAKRLLRTLLDVETPMEDDFIAEQERLHGKNLPHQMYDVTAWSLPLLFNLETVSCSQLVTAELEAVTADVIPMPEFPVKADVAYLVPWGERSAVRLLSRALRDGLRVKSNDKPFVNGGLQFPGGSLIIEVGENPVDLHEHIQRYVQETHARVIAVNDSWVTDGPSFGSGNVVRMSAPRIAIAWDKPVSTYSAGNLRFVIERQFDYPVTPVRIAQLREADLSRYQVLILPDRSSPGYMQALGEEAVARLGDWVSRGGVLIGLAQATQLLADPDAGMLATRREYRLSSHDKDSNAQDKKGIDAKEVSGRVNGTALDSDAYAASIQLQDAEPAEIGGAQLRAQVDTDHWLSAGIAPQLHVLVRNANVYTPLRMDEGVNVARFAGAEEIVASGHLWETNRRQFAYKPFVMASSHGKGQLVAFTQDPTVRAYQDGLNLILANAIFRGAAHARPLR